MQNVLRDLGPKEREIRGPNGRWFLLRIRPYRTTDNKVTGAVVTFNDVTERKRDDVSKESEERYRALVMASSDVVYWMNADWSEMLRLEGRHFLADTGGPSASWMATYIDPPDRKRLQTSFDAAIRDKSVLAFEHRVRRLDGTLGWARSRAVPIFDSSGKITEWLGTAVEVTTPSEDMSALQHSEERLRHLLDAVPNLLWEADAEGRLVLTNRRWQDYVGPAVSATLGWPDVLHPDDAAASRAALEKGAASDAPSSRDLRLHAADGKYRMFLVRHVPEFDTEGRILRWFGSATVRSTSGSGA